MEKEFVPYEQALELKELGFNEPCFAYYENNNLTVTFPSKSSNGWKWVGNSIIPAKNINAPTLSQAFRWFREKHNLRSFVDTRVTSVDNPNMWVYDFQIKMGNGVDTQPFYSGDFDTYEEAELECLKKLIEIVKQKQ